VFDAMSAKNLSLYGYKRQTSPNLERFASRATVYHSHYSGGNFTMPGTASILTGTYPWTHRALNFRGVMKRSMIGNDVFSLFMNGYTRAAFPQNFWANFLLTQFADQIDVLLPTSAFSELDLLFSNYFPNDANMAARALDDFIFKGGGQGATILFTPVEQSYYMAMRKRLPHDGYPKTIPYQVDYPVHFRLEKIFDGLMSFLPDLKPPFFTYLHLLPPHAPYVPSNNFANIFKDGLEFPQKPQHPLSKGLSKTKTLQERRTYDEYIASTDYEFGRFLDFLESNGFLITAIYSLLLIMVKCLNGGKWHIPRRFSMIR